jgi:hypothetical protein
MTDYERKKFEIERSAPGAKNFEKPTDCRNPDQIRFYVEELCQKIDALERDFNYVPEWVYGLLAQCNVVQNRLLYVEFKNSYS